jgi:hypothetical protein
MFTIERLLEALVVRHVGLALAAFDFLLKVRAQADIYEISRADRLRDLRNELAPKPKAPRGCQYLPTQRTTPGPAVADDR